MDSEDDDRFEVNQQYKKREEYSDDEDLPRKSDQSSNQSDQSEENSAAEMELNEKQRLEYEILKAAIEKEKSTPYQQEITREIINKLNDLSAVALGKTGEELVNIKIQELALNKLLVLNYSKSDFRLVIAHYHLGQAYLSYDCLEQAIEHISVALHKNEKLLDQLPKIELLQINMQIALAEAFISQNNYDDAIEMLNKARSLEDNYNDSLRQNARMDERDLTKNIKALVLKAQCFCKQKNFAEALQVIDEVVSYTRSKKMGKIEYAFALVDKANILAEMESVEKYQKAIEYQEEAIDILVTENYPKPEEVAELYSNLSGYFERIGNSEKALTCIQKVKTLYEELYSPEDKRVIKARRKIATALLKSERYKEAVTELLEISKLEEKVFGETIQLARTLKLLGTVYISLEIGDARVYLKRAMNIFQSLGNKKQAQEIKEKLKNLLSADNGEIDINVISQQDI